MKRTFIILSFIIFPLLAEAQDVIDAVFKKYSGSDSFTSIIISKDLLDFAFAINNDKDIDKIKGKISGLKILVSENQRTGNIGFTSEIQEAIEKNSFLNLMEIRDGKSKVNIYAKKNEDKIVHLVLLAIEDDEEILLSLRGEFSTKDLAELGRNSGHNGSFHHLSYLRDLEK
ncbi:MAG: DUF4252 domain-containing protein [Tenuifilaceae bacterium]